MDTFCTQRVSSFSFCQKHIGGIYPENLKLPLERHKKKGCRVTSSPSRSWLTFVCSSAKRAPGVAKNEKYQKHLEGPLEHALDLHSTPSLNTTASVASLPLDIFIRCALLFSATPAPSPTSLLPKHLQQRSQRAVDVAASHVTLHAMMIILRCLWCGVLSVTLMAEAV